jgi:hypothetical protein|tara:strand:- start:6126 stop:7436 length:1311 start_codon:yes stop_codon:yes gene_type:complete
MAATSNGFLDNLVNGILGPKGTMADWQHASRLYVDGNLKLAPKSKFLYHTYFQLDPIVRSILPELKDKHNLEIGMLVKSADLPRYTSNVETRNKYNRKKNVQTGIQYEPITITFHDDNYGVTTALLEAYYRYYFADAGYGRLPGAYNKAGAGDNTYMGSGRNQWKFGLDNNVTVPFFQNIQISQLAKKTYTTYTIVNPIITNWQHDSVDNSDSSGMMQNTITIAYEAVHYSRGPSDSSNPDNPAPTGFGATEHYDKQPSPISLLGGGPLSFDGAFGAGADLYDYISKGQGFTSPLQAGLAAFQLLRGLENLTLDQLKDETFVGLKNVLGDIGNTSVSGVANTVIPKNDGPGGQNDVTSATSINTQTDNSTVVQGSTTKQLLKDNPIALEDAAKSVYKNDYLTDGGTGGVNGINAAWTALPEGTKELYREKALDITL